VKQLSGKHDSKPVNPLIAGAFHRTGAVEVWGRGTNRVIAMCKAHGASPPTFEERSGFLVVAFRAQMATAAVSEEGTQKSSQKGTQTSAQKILSLIEATPSITIEQLAAEVGITDRAVKKQLHNLKKQDRLKRIGPDKGGHWEVVA
jgi:ATP-dependent DNA helicase RecG